MSSLNGGLVNSGSFHDSKKVLLVDYVTGEKPPIMYEAISPADLARIVRLCVQQMIYVDQLNRCPFFRTAKNDGKGLYTYSYLSMVNQANEWAEPVYMDLDSVHSETVFSFNDRTKLIVLCMFAHKSDVNNKQVGLILTVSGRIFEFRSHGHGMSRSVDELYYTDEHEGDTDMANLFKDYPAMAMEVINGLCKLAEKTKDSHQSHVEEWEEVNRFMQRVDSSINFNLPRLQG